MEPARQRSESADGCFGFFDPCCYRALTPGRSLRERSEAVIYVREPFPSATRNIYSSLIELH